MRDENIAGPRIGGSEIAAIFDCHDYLDQFGLWARKKGGLPPDPATPRMRLGKHLEQGIVSYYAEIERIEVEWCDVTSKHPEYPFMAYTPDALVIGEKRGVDAKLVGWDQKHRWGRDAEHIPDHCVMQPHWYMAALDYDHWDVAALVTGEDQPRIYRIERDAEIERIMLRKAKKWWTRYIVGDERPPISDSPVCANWVKWRYPQHRSQIAEATAEEAALLAEYCRVREAWKTVEKEHAKLETQLREAVGEREGIRSAAGQFTWKRIKDSERIRWRDLAESLLINHAAADQLRKEFSYIQEGYRKIRFVAANGEEL